MNKAWHTKHPMPSKATFEQRCAWHSRHAKACGCRAIPKAVAQALGVQRPSNKPRYLSDLSGIGKAMLRDFEQLGIRSVEQLAKADDQKLYDKLCRITGIQRDPCVLDTFSCAIAQSRNPKLPKAQRNWWWWSRKRKNGK